MRQDGDAADDMLRAVIPYLNTLLIHREGFKRAAAAWKWKSVKKHGPDFEEFTRATQEPEPKE
jgi:hypothetical protein